MATPVQKKRKLAEKDQEKHKDPTKDNNNTTTTSSSSSAGLNTSNFTSAEMEVIIGVVKSPTSTPKPSSEVLWNANHGNLESLLKKLDPSYKNSTNAEDAILAMIADESDPMTRRRRLVQILRYSTAVVRDHKLFLKTVVMNIDELKSKCDEPYFHNEAPHCTECDGCNLCAKCTCNEDDCSIECIKCESKVCDGCSVFCIACDGIWCTTCAPKTVTCDVHPTKSLCAKHFKHTIKPKGKCCCDQRDGDDSE